MGEELTPLAYPQVDDNTNPLHFSQVFQLIPEAGGYYVYVTSRDVQDVPLIFCSRFNDIFRLNYG